jgi:hypothetical protein
MRVAVICEYSGVVRDAFIKQGHEAISFDIVPGESNLGEHIIGDVMEKPLNYWEQFDLAICHPPCTYLSTVAAKHLYPKGVLNQERYEKGVEAAEFFMKLYNLNVNRVCVENPLPFKIFELPKHTQVIQPYEHGHPYQKRTLLWLRNLPNLEPTNIVEKRVSTSASIWFNATGKGKDRGRARAKTFEGIAEAMAEQWGSL